MYTTVVFCKTFEMIFIYDFLFVQWCKTWGSMHLWLRLNRQRVAGGSEVHITEGTSAD